MVMYNDLMTEISVTQFKAHCLELVNQVAKSGKPIMLTKRGKPTVMVTPAPTAHESPWQPDRFRDDVIWIGDIVSPIDEDWEENG